VSATLLATRSASPGAVSGSGSRPNPSVGPPAPIGPYQEAVDAAQQHGLRVWLEADLVKRWLAGKDAFDAGVTTLAALSARPGVVGIKIADELGYQDGMDSASKIGSFLADSASALHRAAPGKLLLVDMLVPELGCLPDFTPSPPAASACAAAQRAKYPELELSQVDGYLRAHVIDVLDLSTNLQTANTYADWGVDSSTAQRAAWQEARRRGWDRLVRLQARKALAHPGDYLGTDADARAALTTYVDIPREMGATAVDVWTWRQLYQGEIYRLIDPGLRSNPLWAGLVARHAAGARLFTHLSPHSLERDLQTDLNLVAQAFTDLFVAAGTG